MLHTYQKPLSGSKIGVVFGSFAPLHQGHLDLIMRAKKENDGGCIVIVCGFDGDKGEPLMPHNKRYRYVREFFADDDLVAVYSINDTEIGANKYPDGWNEWMTEFRNIWSKAVIEGIYAEGEFWPERTWYVGDEAYHKDLTERFGQKAILVDRKADNPISATMIRQNPIKHWDKIAFPFRRLFSHNILICGTASEGKTTLCEDLGKYFNAPYGREYARDYMKESGVSEWELDAADYLAFLEGQYSLNRKLINSGANHGVFFADTDSMVTRMYAEAYADDKDLALSDEDFKKVAMVADEFTSKCRWDKIFLLAPKGNFVDDNVRYMGHSDIEQRRKMYNILCSNIKASGNWDKVVELEGGDYYNNFITIVKYVRDIMEKGIETNG